MRQASNKVMFGINIDPSPRIAELAAELASYADSMAIDLIGVQDHPGNPNFFDTWTFMTALAVRTQRVRFLTNVANISLRPPAMLAKAAATFDILTGGRLELGLGAGASPEEILAYGGEFRTPAEAVEALEEAIEIAHLLWQPGDGKTPITFEGKQFRILGARPGPAPSGKIRIWTGVRGRRMLALTGRLADGWVVSNTYVHPEDLPEMQARIDRAAEDAGRSPSQIRRGYNVMGYIRTPSSPGLRLKPGLISGTVEEWADTLAGYYNELGLDTFIYWPVAGSAQEQIRLFAEEVVPAVRRRLQAVG